MRHGNPMPIQFTQQFSDVRRMLCTICGSKHVYTTVLRLLTSLPFQAPSSPEQFRTQCTIRGLSDSKAYACFVQYLSL